MIGRVVTLPATEDDFVADQRLGRLLVSAALAMYLRTSTFLILQTSLSGEACSS